MPDVTMRSFGKMKRERSIIGHAALVRRFSRAVLKRFPDALLVKSSQLVQFGFSRGEHDVCFLLPSDETSGVTLLIDASYEIWSVGGSQTTRSLTTAIACALGLVHESFFSVRNDVDPLRSQSNKIDNVGRLANQSFRSGHL